MEQFFVGRQPIYNRKQQVVAYELLYRHHLRATTAKVTDGDRATSQVIVNSLVDIGLEKLVGSAIAFINLTDSFIRGDIELPFSPKQVILEVLESVEPSTEALTGLRRLAERGFTLALDDFIYTPAFDPFLRLASVVKLDVLGLSLAEITARVQQLKPFKVKLLAEKVESIEIYNHCVALGFSYFQGYYLCKPQIVEGRRLPANKALLLNLMSKVQNPQTELTELEALIQHDVALSYRLLKLINSASYGLSQEIDSIGRALSLLGMKTIRNWISLILLTQVEGKPPELLKNALFRAWLCERLGKVLQPPQAAQFFTVGLFSMLDVLMDQPLEQLLASLPLHSEIKHALLHQSGNLLGEVLHLVVNYEQGRWESLPLETDQPLQLPSLPSPAPITGSQFIAFYLEAVQWADSEMRQLNP